MSITEAPSTTRMLALAVMLILALAAGLLAPALAQDDGGGPDVVVVEVLGNRADLVSDGNALVEVTVPADADPVDLAVDVDGRDVTDAFAVRGNGRFMGVVEGLAVGANVVTAVLPDGRGARLTVTNHPRGGPVFSGPQIQPWTCVGEVTDDQCNRETTFTFSYMPENGGGLQDYDPENPPDDVATTTTTEGEEVPFIVRIENGTMNRDVYEIAILWNPEDPDYQPWAPQRGWNGRMVITHGASCDTAYAMQNASNGVEEPNLLGAGFAVMSHALNNSGHNCNVVVQAESMIMVKEHFTERYGQIRWTIGSGCSGGALAQYWTANAYPGGIYEGITPACSFPDAGSSAMQYLDYDLLRAYFEDPTRWDLGVVWDPIKQGAVYGHPNAVNAVTFTEVIPNSGDPSRQSQPAVTAQGQLGQSRCPGLPNEQLYDAENNPGGVRCTLTDYNINALGTHPEKGWAYRPVANVGIQYGLQGLLEGTLTPTDFVALNTAIGGFDDDLNLTAERYDAELEGLRNMYRSGLNNSATHLDQVAIIDMRGPDPGAFHDTYRTYAMQDRLLREHGTADNMVLWRGQVPILGDNTFTVDGVMAVDRWLAAVDADGSSLGLDEKIIRNRPDDVTDRCTTGNGQDVDAQVCDTSVDVYSTPRIAAGGPLTDDVQACTLVPLEEFDYDDVEFTDEQVTALAEAFPTGVCDYTRPGRGQIDTVAWLDYSDVEGGEPMGPAPVSVPFGPDDPVVPEQPEPLPEQVLRLAGPGRVDTAVEVSRQTWASAETVVIASAETFADALAGAPLAVAERAPLLLSGQAELPPQTLAEIRRLSAGQAIVLGGEAALSPAVAQALADAGLAVDRVAGATREATSVAIAERLTDVGEVVLAPRGSFPDALSVSAMASSLGIPVLLVRPDDLGPAAQAIDADTDVVIVGGTAVIDEAVAAQADQAGGTVTRIAGPTRYATSVAIAQAALDRGLSAETLWIATGRDFPDGLVAGAAAGLDNHPLLLVDGHDLNGSPESMAFVAGNAEAIEAMRIAGGTDAVDGAVLTALAQHV